MLAGDKDEITLKEICERMDGANSSDLSETKHIEPLFKDKEEFNAFNDKT